MHLAIVLAAALLVLWLAVAASGLRGRASLVELEHVECVLPSPAPAVSVVLSARDEARAVAACVRSLLLSDYPDLEVVAVDDRSGDGTGAILDRLAAGGGAGARGRLRVLHVDELPPGWLGKNHGLWLGAGAARGRWLLFTDADVRFGPSLIARAIAWCEAERRDHLAVVPRLCGGGFWLRAVEGAFSVLLTTLTRPWLAASPRSRAFFGVGAFNLVRADAYRRSGTHAAIPLCPDDDVMLAKILKRTGARAAVGMGGSLLSVPWYRSVGEMARGLEKNALAPSDHRPLRAAGAGLLILAALEGPFVLAAAAGGPARWLGAAAGALLLWAYAAVNRESGVGLATTCVLPVAVVLLVAIYLRAVALGAWRGEVRWRGRAYRLAELRGRRPG